MPFFSALSPRASKISWLVSGALTGGFLTVSSWYALTYTWVPFQPICTIGRFESNNLIEFAFTFPYRILTGPLRADFKRRVAQEIYGEARETPDGIFVTIEYFQDLDSYWNYTNRAFRQVIQERTSASRDFKWEKNRRIHDDNPEAERAARERWEVAQFRPIDPDNWRETPDCDVVRYFAIEGAPLPKSAD